MQVNTKAEGGCTGHGPRHGREAPWVCASPGQRARDVTADVAPLVAVTGKVAGG